MRRAFATLPILLAALAAGCGEGGLTAPEMEAAAIDRMRSELNLPEATPLEAEVWAGEEYGGELVLCGTVSGQGGGTAVRPHRFAATEGDPVEWLIFEDAHTPIRPEGHRFPDWGQICELARGA